MKPHEKRILAVRLDATRDHLENLADENEADPEMGYVVACLADAVKALEYAAKRLRGESTRA